VDCALPQRRFFNIQALWIQEDLMSTRTFDSPVFVKDGNRLIQEIACLEDALEFLYDWPQKRRGPIHATALRACQKAFETDYPLSAARSAFVGFAKSYRILEDIGAVMPWAQAPTAPSGGMRT
jgi:5,10-methenyltetrahydromethanopterin hydrogenase